MTYELAKELKDAGFPQTGFIGGHFYSKDGIRWQSSIERSELTYGDIKEPTLEELIAACGDRFGALHRRFDSSFKLLCWQAVGYNSAGEMITFDGPDPVTAVSRLWLALNAK